MKKQYTVQTRDDLFLLGNLHIASRAIHIMADFPIADFLTDGPKSCKAIADQFDFDQTATGKLLRVLSSFGVLEENGNGSFSLTDAGHYLCHSHPESLKDLLFYDESRWSPFGRLERTLITGLPAFNELYEKPYFNHLEERPDLQKRFNRHMAAVSTYEDRVLAKELPLRQDDHFMDIGGGAGSLVLAALNQHKQATASLFDLPEVIDNISGKLDHRITPVKGSFFEPINAKCDAAILKRVLHDWNDEECLKILHNAKNTLKPGGKLLVIETVLQGAEDPPLTRLFDLFLLTLFGGGERSLQDYRDLFEKADLTLSGIINTDCSMSILEARKQ
jgi:ubiquinone/menaquinone biosynthesis C-methylase UbiE